MRITGLTALALGAALAITGCTKAADSPTVAAPAQNSAALSDPGSAIAGPASDSSAPVASTPPPPSANPSPSSPSSSAAAPKTSTPPNPPASAGCPANALTISVNRGSGVAGHQYATVVFTNKSAAACPLTGFPVVQLLAGGAPIGSSVRSSAAAATVTLAPGASASSQLINDSTCGAGESDSIQVAAPDTSTPTVLPLVFRGCTLTVGPVTSG